MATFKSFEDIQVWQRAHAVSVDLYKIANSTALKRDFGLKDQMLRASVSVTSNIAEGHDRGTKNQFIYFLNVSRGSCAELRSQLILAKDLDYIEVSKYETLKSELIEISRMLAGLIKYLKTVK